MADARARSASVSRATGAGTRMAGEKEVAMGLLDRLRGRGSQQEQPEGGDVHVGTPEEHVGVDPRAPGGDMQQERVNVGTPEEAAEDTYHGPVDTEAEDRHEEERARHSGI